MRWSDKRQRIFLWTPLALKVIKLASNEEGFFKHYNLKGSKIFLIFQIPWFKKLRRLWERQTKKIFFQTL